MSRRLVKTECCQIAEATFNMQRVVTERPANVGEISRLAYLSWEREGCPVGRAEDYWLEAECQFNATWHLHLKENAARANKGPMPAPAKAKPRILFKCRPKKLGTKNLTCRGGGLKGRVEK